MVLATWMALVGPVPHPVRRQAGRGRRRGPALRPRHPSNAGPARRSLYVFGAMAPWIVVFRCADPGVTAPGAADTVRVRAPGRPRPHRRPDRPRLPAPLTAPASPARTDDRIGPRRTAAAPRRPLRARARSGHRRQPAATPAEPGQVDAQRMGSRPGRLAGGAGAATGCAGGRRRLRRRRRRDTGQPAATSRCRDPAATAARRQPDRALVAPRSTCGAAAASAAIARLGAGPARRAGAATTCTGADAAG